LALSLATAAGPQDAALDALVAAYPDELIGHAADRIFWRDGSAMPAGDRRSNGEVHKSFEELLRNASILDQFRQPYPRGTLAAPPAVNDDPGRFRNEAFFLKMYGDCRAHGFAASLAPVVWLPHSWGQTIRATRINGVAEKLSAVSADIEALPPDVRRAAYPVAGVLACRPVKDTGKLSMHAFAAAIDLNLAFSDYWLWHKPEASGATPYRNRMPQEIVDVFERHGFIWGGKWYHYDTMHFEYRPELLANPRD
jgi:hypothetical protein